MLRTVLVAIHAGGGIAGLVAGIPALFPPADPDRRVWIRRLYAACITVLLSSMVVLIAVDWPGLDAGARTAFSGLTGLGAVMAYRLGRAYAQARTRPDGWRQRYVDHVYFTYVSLWIGFLIVPALGTTHPQVGVPLVVVTVLVSGHLLVARAKQRMAPAS